MAVLNLCQLSTWHWLFSKWCGCLGEFVSRYSVWGIDQLCSLRWFVSGFFFFFLIIFFIFYFHPNAIVFHCLNASFACLDRQHTSGHLLRTDKLGKKKLTSWWQQRNCAFVSNIQFIICFTPCTCNGNMFFLNWKQHRHSTFMVWKCYFITNKCMFWLNAFIEICGFLLLFDVCMCGFHAVTTTASGWRNTPY